MTFLPEAARHVVVALPGICFQILWIALCWALLWGTGRGWVGRWLGPLPGMSPAVSAAVWPIVGTAVLGTVGFFLGLVGGLSPSALGLVALLGNALAAPAWRDAGQGWRAWSVRDAWPWAAAGLVFLPTVLLTLYPPRQTDPLLYHLPMTRSLAETGRLLFLDTLRYPVFPQLQETLWSAAFGPFGLPGAAALVLLQAGLVAVAVHAATRLRVSTTSPAPLLAAALFLGCPAVALFGTAAFVDVPLAACVAVAGLCLTLALGTGDRRWAALAGIAAGAGAATKYHGAVLAGLLTLPWLWAAFRPGRLTLLPRGTALRRLALYALTAAAVAAPWYGRNLALTGNPVFPFLGEAFGELTHDGLPYADPAGLLSARSEEDYGRARPDTADAVDRGGESSVAGTLGRRALHTLDDLHHLPRLIAELTVIGGHAHGPPPFAVWLLPLVVLALGIAVARRRSPGWPVVLAGLYCGFWFVTFRDPRYLLPAVALALPALVGRVDRTAPGTLTRRALPTPPLVALALLLSAPGWLYGAYRVASLGTVPKTPEAVRAFHDRLLPGHDLLPEVTALRRPGDTVYLLGRPRLRYFLPGRVLGEHLGFHAFGTVASTLHQPGAAAPLLRRWGVDLLVTFAPTPPPPAPPGSGLEEVFRDQRGAIFRVTADTPE